MSITVTSLYNSESEAISYTNGAATMDFVVPNHEDGLGLLIKNTDATSSAVVTIKAGNSIYAMSDLAVTVAASGEAIVNLKNTGRFKNVYGTNSGKILLTVTGVTASSVKLCVFEL